MTASSRRSLRQAPQDGAPSAGSMRAGPAQSRAPQRPVRVLEQATTATSATPRGHWLLWELGPNQCHWPHGDGPFTFCGAERTDDPQYCAEHAAIFYARR